MSYDARDRLLEEVYRLKWQIQNCANCAALRAQIVNLYNIMPGEPMFFRRTPDGTLMPLLANTPVGDSDHSASPAAPADAKDRA